MSDRRKAQRFAYTNSPSAALHLVQDVFIVQGDAETLTVLSPTASLTGEELAVRLRGPGGQLATVAVRTVASRPVMVDGKVQYRIDLRVIGSGSVEPDVRAVG